LVFGLVLSSTNLALARPPQSFNFLVKADVQQILCSKRLIQPKSGWQYGDSALELVSIGTEKRRTVMLNWSLGLGGILGIVLALAGVGLYFLRTVRPNLAREHDIFFAAVALLCGGILLFQSWRLDPILQFAQFLSIGSAIWFAYEAIRLRGITTEQAKRSTPLVDDERPVSRVYRAELDELTPLDEQRVTRRIRGSRDGRPEEGYEDDRRYADRGDRYGNGGNANGTSNGGSPSDRRRPRNSRPLPPERSEADRRPDRDNWGDYGNARDGSAGSGMRESIRDDSFSPRTRNSNRPAPSPRRRGGDSDYVDYQPVDFPEDNPNPKDDWR
jgi:hypothetical protein